MLLGFFEDNNKILLNVRQELVLIRARNDSGAYVSTENLKFNLNKIHWKVPHIYVNDEYRLKLLKTINSN